MLEKGLEITMGKREIMIMREASINDAECMFGLARVGFILERATRCINTSFYPVDRYLR